MKKWSIFCLLFVAAFPSLGWGAERSYGSFEVLGKPWFIVSMSEAAQSDDVNPGFRFEFKVTEDQVSPRRFRTLWLDALTSSGADVNLHAHSADLNLFFDAIRGELLKGDHLALEFQGDSTIMTINHYEHARMDGQFMALFIDSLTDRIAPIPALRDGLLNQISSNQRRQLEKDFMSQDVSLARVTKTARWLRYGVEGQGEQLSLL